MDNILRNMGFGDMNMQRIQQKNENQEIKNYEKDLDEFEMGEQQEIVRGIQSLNYKKRVKNSHKHTKIVHQTNGQNNQRLSQLEEEKMDQDENSSIQPQDYSLSFINDDLRGSIQRKLNQLLAQVMLEQSLYFERHQFLEKVAAMTLYTAFTQNLIEKQNEINKQFMKLQSKIEQMGNLIEMMLILNSRRQTHQNLFDNSTVEIIRNELQSLINFIKDQNQNSPNQVLVLMISQIERLLLKVTIFDPHDMAIEHFMIFPRNLVSNKMMLENMFFDVKTILNHAPQLQLENHEDGPKCLPMDLLVVNAFGQLSENKSVSVISNSQIANFTYLTVKKKILKNIMSNHKTNQKDILSIQVSILSRILLQMQDELFEKMSVTFGNQNTVNFRNDIVLRDDGSIGNQHFKIRYCPYLNKFFIRDLEGSGTFAQVNEPTQLVSGSVICIGETFITVGILYDELIYEDEDGPQHCIPNNFSKVQQLASNATMNGDLILKVNDQSEMMKFQESDAPILIGRSFENHIQCPYDTTLSKFHARIEYQNNAWMLKDGSVGGPQVNNRASGLSLNSNSNNSVLNNSVSNPISQQSNYSDIDQIHDGSSTNGTWLFLCQEQMLQGQQVIKVGNYFIKTKVIENE